MVVSAVLHGPAYQSLGFRFDDISYISDVSVIPPETEALMAGSQMVILDALNCASRRLEHVFEPVPAPGVGTHPEPVPLPLSHRAPFAGDKPHASHLCALQAIEYIDRLQPRLGYLTGFAHLVGHDTAETTVRVHSPHHDPRPCTPSYHRVSDDHHTQLSARPATAPEIHPAYDGLLVPWPPATTR